MNTAVAEVEEESVTHWIRNNDPEDKMLWKGSLGDQVVFARGLPTMLYGYERGDSDFLYEKYKDAVKVIGTHTSKSIACPVYKFVWNGITFIMRDNFYNWKVSVDSEIPLDIDFEGIFSDEEISSCYCEGFLDSQVYGSYFRNHKQFTVELSNRYKMYFFFRKIGYYFGCKAKVECPLHTTVQKIIDMLPEEIANIGMMGDRTFKGDLEKIRNKAIISIDKTQNWSYLGTIISLAIHGNKDIDKKIKTDIYQTAFGDNWEKEKLR